MGVLLVLLRKKIGAYAEGLGRTLIKCMLAALIMAAVVVFVNYGMTAALPSQSVSARLIKLAVPVFAGIVTYGAAVILLRVEAVKPLLDTVKNKLGKAA